MSRRILVGLSGLAGSGKSTVAAMLRPFGFVDVALADPMKEFCRSVFDFSAEQLYGPSEIRSTPDPRYLRPDGTYLTPREALQRLGTEWGRECYPNVWPNACLLGIKRRGLAKAVITDVRFKNEIETLRAAGAVLVRIIRPGAGLKGAAGLHPSETEQASIPDSAFDHVIMNDGSLLGLEKRLGNVAHARGWHKNIA